MENFNKLFLSDYFQKPPESIIYLHIDLNSSELTLAALDFFFPKLVHGGIIIFDDYGWISRD